MQILYEEQFKAANLITNVNIEKLKIRLREQNNLRLTMKTLDEVLKLSSELPAQGSIKKFTKDDSHSIMFIKSNGNIDASDLDFIGGTVGLLTESYKAIEILKTELEKLIQEQEIEDFSKFGKWEEKMPPNFFILNRGILTLIAFYFNLDLFPHFKSKNEAYEFIHEHFRKDKRSKFSFLNISKLEMKIKKKNQKLLLEKYDLDDDDCFDFITYCVNYFKNL